MKTSFSVSSFFALATLCHGQDRSPAGFLGEFARESNDVEEKIVALAQAVPQEKLTWRPADDVRSVSEVFLHLARGNYSILNQAGIVPPADVNLGTGGAAWERSTTRTEEIVVVLKKSFEHLRHVVAETPRDSLEKSVVLFGKSTTLRDAFLRVALHQHEHLGQSIAYARMNGIVPPWTAERMAREKKQ